MPVHYPGLAGKPYRPSNGTEGMIFEEQFCHFCTKSSAECEIYLWAGVYQIGDENYPREWIYDSDGRPTCTAFCDRREVPTEAQLNDRIKMLEAALRAMTSNRVHDAFCLAFEDWETEHQVFEAAKELVNGK